MSMQRRLTIATAVVISIVAVSIGSIAVINSFSAQVNRVDSRLASDANSVKNSVRDALSTALLLAGQDDIPVTAAYISSNQELTVIKESTAKITKVPSRSVLKSAESATVGLDTDPNIRIRSVNLGDGDYVIFASSISDLVTSRNQQIKILLFVMLVSIAIAVFIVNRLIRRDIGLIAQLAAKSTLIASGDTSVRLPESHGRSEVAELTQSLNVMVTHLVDSVEKEKSIHRAMQNFLSDASHELRTPLTVIQGYTEILNQVVAEKSDQEKRAFDRIMNELKRMNELIDDLLLLAELGERQVDLSGKVALDELIKNAVQDLQVLQPNRIVSTSITANISIIGSENLLQQLFANIFQNIIRHTPSEAEVTVQLFEDSSGIRFIVDDAGPGLPAQAYDEGVQQFQRFDDSRSRKTGGSGLGMSIMNAIVDQHHGTMELSRSELGGLQTSITFPK